MSAQPEIPARELGHPGGPAPHGLAVIGFAEALSGPECTWSLADAGFRVVAFSRRHRRCALHYSRYATVHPITAPETDAGAALGELKDLLATLRRAGSEPQVVLPLDDAAVWLCARLGPLPGIRVAGPQAEGLRLALDKRFQTECAQRAGFHVPASRLVGTKAELLECAELLPLIARPAEAIRFDGRRITKGRNLVCGDRSELERSAGTWGGSHPLLVQPFVAGQGEGVFGLAAASHVEAWSAHRRVRMMNPQGSGSSACESQPVPEGICDPITRLISAVGWQGLFMVELLHAEDGRRWFVEFNGRPWGSMALSRALALEYPAWAALQALDPGFSPSPAEAPTSPCRRRHVGRELLHLLFVLRGPSSKTFRQWPRFWQAVGEMRRWGRGSRCYNWRRNDWRVFIADTLFTLHDQVLRRRG